MIVPTNIYRDHLFTISHDPDEPGYTVDFLDIPEIITSGPTLTKAFSHACEAHDLYLETLELLGRPLPQPRHRLVV